MGEAKISIMEKYGKSITIIATAFGVIMMVGLGLYVVSQRKPNVSSENEISQPVPITSIGGLGRIEPRTEVINVSPSPSLAGARVKTLLVKEGDWLKKGDIIAYTSDYDLKKAELERAKKELTVAQENLNIVKAGAKEGSINAQKAIVSQLQAELQGAIATDRAKINRLQAQLASEREERQATIDRLQAEKNNAQAQLNRYEQLAKEGVISASELDDRQLTLETADKRYQEALAIYRKTISTLSEEINEAQALATQRVNTLNKQIASAQATLNEISEIRPVDVAQAQAQVESAVALVNQAEVDLDLTIIKAPIDGEIIDINAYPGENISSDQGIVEIGNTQEMIVVAEIYESDISKVKLGQETQIRSENNSFDGIITGKIAEISSKIGKKDVLETDPAASVDARVVEVKIAVNPEDNNKIKNLIYSQVIVNILL
ncbi:HlyD family efflux transporter periplasmic adaptor subunit [Cyanobacterium aponinum 0216]|uniref:HlyD family efflux transporter periplasmic adaptor subunit n=2 Tax=Cyanobacterium TaxID=102234 RepID=A0A844GUN6_9CHRO|nr:HlyD family efflux transporter periplasmic adaptor subunit [Cyanobacterium aponinum 0216]